jgi:hypothetical protein
VTENDYRISVEYSLTGSCDIQLPSIASVGERDLRFKDGDGNASVNNIHILGNGSDTIDGAATASMKSNYEGFTLYNNGINKWFVE